MTVMAKVVETNESEESNVEESGEEELEASEDDDADNPKSNAGWADAISKILKTNKPKGKKTLVLSRAKKLTDVKKQTLKPAGFEVATADGEIKEEKVEVETETAEPQPAKRRKKELLSFRVKPNILEKDRERTLTKIATKGVVQLFNAVKMQQKDIGKKLQEAGPLEVRKEKALKSVDKREFLNMLMGEKSQVVEEAVGGMAKSEKTGGEETWSVLRDDFMMGAKLKNWDKELEKGTESEREVEIESD